MYNNIVRPGIMFQVIKPTKDNIFRVGTIGFIKYVEGQDQNFPNIVFYKVIIIRRGKSGKFRLESNEISVPIFLPKHENIENIFSKVNHKHFLFINTSLNLMPKNILNFDNYSFLGWATSWGHFLNKLYTKVKGIEAWPHNKNHILNIITRLPNKFIETPEHTLKTFTTKQFRTKIIMEIRRFESVLSRCAIKYLYEITCIEQKALIYSFKNPDIFKLEKKQFEKINQSIKNKIAKLETNI
ncbi:MAG: hypothetical protein U9Q27_03495 [Patescibacteria group bacterium]|nr:hypothetical protein [Patescibacteria group bacterium]